MKEIKAYGIDLNIPMNFEKTASEDFLHRLEKLDGFIGCAPYGGGEFSTFDNSPTMAGLFDTMSNRNKAYNELSKDLMVGIILESCTIPVGNNRG